MAKHKFRVYQGCPLTENIAPFIAIIVGDAHGTLDSGYRGDDAKAILNAHGHHSQAQIYWTAEHGTAAQRRAMGLSPDGGGANPPGVSTHELKSDGVAYPSVPRGHDLAWWQLGFDVNDADVDRVIAQAHSHGWDLWRPYSAGKERHHLNFRAKPRPGPRTALRIIKLRLTLPKR